MMAVPSVGRTPSWVAPVGIVAITAMISYLRALWTPGFYFADDTQLGAVGIWWELGDRLLRGDFPTLNPQTWQAGNYWAEGQWGLINPVIWAVGLATRLSADVAVTATVVKIVFLAVLGLGTYVLARSFGASIPWAFAAGVLVPQAGVTVYLDAASWVSDLITTALFPWVWWTLRRAMAGRSPIPFLLLSYLLVTTGYVYGTIFLAVILVEGIATAIGRRQWRPARWAAAASVWSGLWAVVIYLPGVLTAPVTERGTSVIANNLFLNADVSDLAASAMPVASATIGAWWGSATLGPLAYIAWTLPLLLLVNPFTRSLWQGTRTLLVVGGVALVFVLGPSDLGPLRWPIRLMPYLAIAALVLFAVAMTRGYPHRVSRGGLIAAVAVAGTMAWLSWAQTPSHWRSFALCMGVQIVVVAVAAYLARRRATVAHDVNGDARWSRGDARMWREWQPAVHATGAVVAIIAVCTAGFAAYQLRAFPVSPLPTFAVPHQTAELRGVGAGVEGDMMTTGDALSSAFAAETFDEALVANLWYYSPAAVANTYTVLPFSAFSKDLCMDLRGSTCADAVPTLFSVDPTTGAPVVDLLAVSSVLGYRATLPDPPRSLPDGWSIVSEGDSTWRAARSTPVVGAGGVTWTGAGTRVREEQREDTSVTLHVEAVGSDPRVVLSRLAWPGYRVTGATLADPIRGYLLTVDLADAGPGDTVTVTFRPPGFPLMVTSGVLALLLGAIWVADHEFRRRRRPITAG